MNDVSNFIGGIFIAIGGIFIGFSITALLMIFL
jgi:hypothetical protein